MEDFIGQIKYGSEILAMVVAIAAVLSAVIPDEKLPGWLATGLNFLAVNVGKAKNAPNQ